MASNADEKVQNDKVKKVNEFEFLNYSIRLEVVKKKPKKIDESSDGVEVRAKKKMSKEDIGLPKNFKHLSHVGLSNFGEQVAQMIQKQIEVTETQKTTPPPVSQRRSIRQKRLKSFEDIPEDSESLAGEAFKLSDSFEFGFEVIENNIPLDDHRKSFSSVRARTSLYENINADSRQSLPTASNKF